MHNIISGGGDDRDSVQGVYFPSLQVSWPWSRHSSRPSPTLLARPGFDLKQMSDMSDFDPTHPAIPTGDTIKIRLMQPFSGAAASSGEDVWLLMGWVAHDINSRGGILVDGKRKKIQSIKGDTQGSPTLPKRWRRGSAWRKGPCPGGDSGDPCRPGRPAGCGQTQGHLHELLLSSDDLMGGKNFNRYTFRTCWTTTMVGSGMAYYYLQRPEHRFYILCQDYLAGTIRPRPSGRD